MSFACRTWPERALSRIVLQYALEQARRCSGPTGRAVAAGDAERWARADRALGHARRAGPWPRRWPRWRQTGASQPQLERWLLVAARAVRRLGPDRRAQHVVIDLLEVAGALDRAGGRVALAARPTRSLSSGDYPVVAVSDARSASVTRVTL